MKSPHVTATGHFPLAALLALLTLGGCGGQDSAAQQSSAPALAVHVMRVSTSAPGALVLPARVTARQEVTLNARLAAQLTSLPVLEGQHFAAGVVLARFSAPETQAFVAGADAGLAAAKLARDIARRQESRMDSLFAQHVASARELEGAQAERRAAESAWAEARARSEGVSSGATLLAPFAGVVVRRHADPGATMGPGQPVLDLRSDAVDEITAVVPESELASLTSAHAEYQMGEGTWRPAVLLRVDGMTDPQSRTRVARFRASAPAALEAGAFARIRLAGAVRTSAEARAWSVPVSALVTRGGLSGVYVVEGGRARLRWLRVGRIEAGAVEVLAGLRPGDDVVAAPGGLSDGCAVQVQAGS
jgi:RND family efflux transporter MFP subunit